MFDYSTLYDLDAQLGDVVVHNILSRIEGDAYRVKPYNDMLTILQSGMGGTIPTPYSEEVGSDKAASVVSTSPDQARAYHDFNKAFRVLIANTARELQRLGKYQDVSALNTAYWHSMWLDTTVDFDSYVLYIEKNRPVTKRFYQPRRKQLLPVVNLLQGLADDQLDIVSISLPPGVGKSALAIFFMTWLAGRDPDEPILTGSHSNAFVRGVYDECLRVFDKNGEYLWRDVFPGLSVVSTNAKDNRIDLGKPKRFQTLMFTSVGSGNSGLFRATNLLFCDDLVSGLEEALSRDRLDKLWETYTTDLRQRKQGDHCKELHIATRWSVSDVIGRLQLQYEGDPRARFYAIPALDEHDESNFDYVGGVGFTTAFYHEQRSVMDDASWRALYMNEPIEREGLLYAAEELRRYFELPDREPDGIIAVCDSKAKGEDYCVMPIVYMYGNDLYIEDVVCENGDTRIIEDMLIVKCLKHKVQMCQFETNSAGWRIAQNVQERIRDRNGVTKITTRYTTANKETRIIMSSGFVKTRCLFKDDSVIRSDPVYRRFMNFVCSYTMSGRNKHDDCVDALAMLSTFVENMSSNRVEVIQRPW